MEGIYLPTSFDTDLKISQAMRDWSATCLILPARVALSSLDYLFEVKVQLDSSSGPCYSSQQLQPCAEACAEKKLVAVTPNPNRS